MGKNHSGEERSQEAGCSLRSRGALEMSARSVVTESLPRKTPKRYICKQEWLCGTAKLELGTGGKREYRATSKLLNAPRCRI